MDGGAVVICSRCERDMHLAVRDMLPEGAREGSGVFWWEIGGECVYLKNGRL